tara:strand:- start:283 stop:915 length:633 start_codon:yes stop_codon:yes gene_type:complete
MPTESVRIDDRVLEEALQRKPHYLSTTAFLSQIIDSSNKKEFANLTLPPLQSPHHNPPLRKERFGREREGLNESEANVHKGREREGKENKTIRFQFVVPDSLDWCKGDLTTFWKVGKKKGTPKNSYAAEYLFNQIEKIEKDFGRSFVLEQIAQATAKGWQSITHSNAVKFADGIAKDKYKHEPKHPAYMEWKDPYLNPPLTNEVLDELIT